MARPQLRVIVTGTLAHQRDPRFAAAPYPRRRPYPTPEQSSVPLTKPGEPRKGQTGMVNLCAMSAPGARSAKSTDSFRKPDRSRG
jgi:hypothetical protein